MANTKPKESDNPLGGTGDGHIHPTPVGAVLAPIAAFGATFLARRLLGAGYRVLTGSPAPSLKDPTVSVASVVVWTVVSATTAALIEVAIYRATNQAHTDN